MDGKVPLDSPDSDPRYPSSVAPFAELIHASNMIKQEFGLTSDELRTAHCPNPNVQYRRTSSSPQPQYNPQTTSSAPSSAPSRSGRFDPVRDASRSGTGYTAPSGYAYRYPIHQEQQMAMMTREDPSLSASRHSSDFPVRPVAGGSPRPPSAGRRSRTASNPRPRTGQQQQQSADERAQAEWDQAKANHLAHMKHEHEQAALAWSRNQRMLQQLDVQEGNLVVEGTLIDLWELASLVEEFRGLYEVSHIARSALSYRYRQGAYYRLVDKVEKNSSWRFIGARIGLPTLCDPNVPMQATPNGAEQLRRLYLQMNKRGLEKFVSTERTAMLQAGQPAPYHGFQPR